MVYSRFSLFILFRVILMIATITSLATIFLRPDLLFTQIILAVLILVQIYELTYFVNKTNHELNRFLASIKDGDFSVNFSKSKQSSSFKALNVTFNEIVETLMDLETEKAAQLHFLNQVIDQIEFGIITFNEKDHIELMNGQASTLLSLPRVSNWRNLKNPNIELLDRLVKMKDVRNHLIEIRIDQQDRYFSVSITSIKILQQSFKIVSFQDIRSEIQQKEIEAWHKLIRILTHEIMNSVTPLVSLTETIGMIISHDQRPKSTSEITEENMEDVNQAVSTIRDRCEGILKFVKDYRKLTRIPKPEFEEIRISELVDETVTLFSGEINNHQVRLDRKTEEAIVHVDRNLMQQVLINLVKNAIEAVGNTTDPKIRIETKKISEGLEISITDNGKGIPHGKLDKIFVPFYTTKAEGSGIGLSLSRQILNLHGGHVMVNSDSGGTRFRILLPHKVISSQLA